nr:guanylate binding protein family member 6 [Pipistrellus kuhlii]
MAAERAKKEAAEKEQEVMKQKLQEQQQQMEAQKKSLEENILQLKEKMEKERENIIKEQTMMLEHKLKVQEDLLNEGFKKKADEMNAEISNLKNMINNAKKDASHWIEKALDVFSVMCLPGNPIVRGIESLIRKKK